MDSGFKLAIRRVSIAQFRCIDELELSFVGPDEQPVQTVVLAGPNGSGKTSVLEACLFAGGQAALVYAANPTKVKTLIKSPVRVTASIQTENGLLETTFVENNWRVASPLTKHHTPGSWPMSYFASSRTPRLGGPIAISTRKPRHEAELGQQNRLSLIKQHMVNLKAFPIMSSDENRREATAKYQRFLDRLNSTWKLFHPQWNGDFDVQPVGEDASEGFDVFLIGGNNRISLDELSSGELELFIFATSMLSGQFEGGIICIDEPELHLDPQWHSVLLKALCGLQPQSQFIVATHSPEIFDSVSSYQRHLLIPKSDPRYRFWKRSAS